MYRLLCPCADFLVHVHTFLYADSDREMTNIVDIFDNSRIVDNLQFFSFQCHGDNLLLLAIPG